MPRVIVKLTEALRFMHACLKAAGAPHHAAQLQAQHLLHADRLGHFSHGLNKLEMHVNDILSGACQPKNIPVILKQTASTAWVDAKYTMGSTSSDFATDLAISKAQDTGLGWIVVKGANHNGIVGQWAAKIANNKLIGWCFANTPPLLAPTRSKTTALGTNPIATVAQADENETFYMDISTSAVSIGKIQMYRRRKEKIPRGWALGPNGETTEDPEVAVEYGALMPLGSFEETSSYKGFGLAAMVEVFCGISAGSAYGHRVRPWSQFGGAAPANLGHCFVAIDPERFAPGFGKRLLDCMKHWRSLEPSDPAKPVLVPGDMEKKALKVTEEAGEISYLKQLVLSTEPIAKRLSVKPIEWTPDKKSV